MSNYDPSLTLRDAVRRYFADNHFGDDGGYGSRWVEMKLGPVPLVIPNSAGRVRAVRFHDLHHIATGYETSWAGEFEIAAWEVASGCADHYAAWWLNLGGLIAGLMSTPRRTYRAFLRGRRSRNLYRREYTETLLAQRVGALQAELGVNAPPPEQPSLSDLASLCGYTLLGMPVGAVTFLGTVALLPVAAAQLLLRRRAAVAPPTA